MQQLRLSILCVLGGALGAQAPGEARAPAAAAAPVKVQGPAGGAPLLEIRPLAVAAAKKQEDGSGGNGGGRDRGIDLAAEQARLKAWLDTRGNRASLRRDPQLIRLFNSLKPEQGGPLAAGELRWYPSRVQPDPIDPKRWEHRYSARGPAVAVFADAEYEAGPKPGVASLLELLPVDVAAEHFTAEDIAPQSVRVTDTEVGPALNLEIVPARAAAFEAWSEKLVGRQIAYIALGEVVSAPLVASPVRSKLAIAGLGGRERAEALALELKKLAVAEAPGETEVKISKGLEVEPAQIPAGADPEDLRAIQGAQQMLAAERRLKEMIKAGKITGIDRILTFEEISSWPYEDGLKGIPKAVKRLDGKTVLMTGFMLPIDEVENIKEFLIVQSLWACCFGRPPDINGIVRVQMKGKSRIDYQFDPIKVTGTFKVHAAYEDGYCVDIFQLVADSVEVLK